MKKRFQLLALSVLCTVCTYAQYVAPSEGVFRIVNVAYNAALMEDFLNHTLHCTATIGDNDDYEQLWILKETNNGYSLQNVFTGGYIQTGNDVQEKNYWTDATAKTFNIILGGGEKKGYNIFDPGLTNKGLHSKGVNGNVVRWVDCDASQWQFEKVSLTDGELAAAREEFARLTGGDKLPGYQAVLDEVFADKACTVLSEAYAAKSAEEIETALADKLPAELVAMAVKVKNDAWAEANEKAGKKGWDANYAKKFRVQMIEPYSIQGEITEWIGHQGHTNMDNPTGLYANKREVLYIMVEGKVKEGSELWANWITGHSKMPNYNNGYTNGIRLKEGLNVVPMASDGSALYINYLVHTFDKEKWQFAHKLSNFDDLKVHIEGGYINGYYNVVGDALYTPDNDDDWKYYEERANLENITILGRYEVLQFELNDVVDHEEWKDGVLTDTWSHRGLAKLFPEELPAKMPNSPAFTADNQRINAIVEAWDRIFLSEKMTLGVASKAEVDSMNKLFPRYDATWTEKGDIYTYDDKLQEFCNKIKERDGDYGEYYNHHGLAFGTRTGYMYGSWDHSGYHINTTPSILTAIATQAGPTWGPAHEIGHQHQALYTLNGEMEVTNNTFANIAVWYMGMGTSRVNGTEGNLAHAYDNFKNGNYIFGNNIWVLTQRYYRLWLYYHRAGNNTQFYPRLFELIRKTPLERSYGSGSEMQKNEKTGEMESVSFQLTNGYRSYLRFYQLCCEAAQEDLTEFFRAYGCFVPVDGVFQGDYTNSKYYTTQEEIDKAIAEVKKKGYPVNNLPLFINDCTPDKTYGHDGKTQRSYWDDDPTANWGAGYYPTSKRENAEVGCYVDFLAKDPITGEYAYSLVNLKLTIDGGDNAVGFAVYTQDGEIKAFSNHHSFSINKEVENLMRAGEATLYAVGADGNDVAVINKAMLGTPEEQLARMKEALAVAESYIARTDDTDLKIGYLIPDSITDYIALVEDAKAVIDSADNYSGYKTYGQWYVELDAANIGIAMNASAHVPLTPDCYYSIALGSNEDRYVGTIKAGLNTKVLEEPTDTFQWKIEPAVEKGTYYFKNRDTGMYISVVSKGARVKAEASTTAGAVALRLVEGLPGEFYIQPANNDEINFYSYIASGTYRVQAGDTNDDKAKWVIRLTDNMLGQPDTTVNNNKMALYYLQRTDNEEYACYTAERGGTGRIKSDEIDQDFLFDYWFYFAQGSEEGKYTIYSYQTGLPFKVISDNEELRIYANNKKNSEDVEFTIERNEEGNGLNISAEEGYWNIEGTFLTLEPTPNTAWRLERICYASLAVDQKEVTIPVGNTAKIAAEITPLKASGDDIEVTWSSSNQDVATVDAEGNIKAVAEGNATITAVVGRVVSTCEVTVVPQQGEGIDMTTTDLHVLAQGGIVVVKGLAENTEVSVYSVAGVLIGTTTTTGGTATIDTKLAAGNSVIVKIGDYTMKVSL